MVGEVLADRYELEQLVGTGGMSSVYRAHDRLLERKVALKVLHKQFSGDDEYIERFRREARAVAALSHPNIVTVIDRGEHDERQFIVFEYIEGDNLKEVIQRRGPAPVETALELAMQVARGLSFAHGSGLVHRDVKPQNVLIAGNGEAKVTDFGIARSLDVQHGMTQTGTVLGTSDYIAPEQAQGQRVDEHTDVYSLGVVLYELLTNEVPFPGENFVAVAMRHINEPPPSVRERRSDVSPRLDLAVRRAMAKSPSDRFPTMADFSHELEVCLGEVRTAKFAPIAAPPRVSGRRTLAGVSTWPLVAALVGLLAVGGAIAFTLTRGGDGGGSTSSNRGGGGGAAVPHLRAVGAYDPYGGDGEHDGDAPKATDRNAGTYWTTERYSGGLNKAGVGLVLDAGRSVRLHRVGIATDTPGFTAVIRASASASAGFGAPISSSRIVGSQTTFTISADAPPRRYYLIWVTKLADAYAQAHVNEAQAT